MGLDWQPIDKPKPGHEAAFDSLYEEIVDSAKRTKSSWTRMGEIGISPYETLDAPRVGYDAAADQWSNREYAMRPLKKLLVSRRKWQEIFHSYYVLDLVPPNDGVPVYSNGGLGSYCEVYTFRARFLDFCEDMLALELLGEAWEHHRAGELRDYGARLREQAAAFAEQQGVTDVLGKRYLPETIDDWEHPATKAHIVDSAARWCLFWGERGHGMFADY